jgi:hypothetical protein
MAASAQVSAMTIRCIMAPRWFTEGFDTADLQEAQALPEELS